MKHIFSILFSVFAILSLAAAKKPDWNFIPSTLSKDSKAQVESFSPSEFNLTLTPGPGNNSTCAVQVVRTFDTPQHAQRKLSFRARCPDGGSVRFHLIVTTRQNGRIVTHWGPKFTVSGKEFSRHLFGLDSAFGMLDREYHIWQIKPIIGISGTKAGSKVTVEVRDFQIDSAENIGSQSDKPSVTVHPGARRRTVPESNALKVYFQLDNDDDVPVSAKGMTDPIPYRGYREMLLDTVKESVVLVDSPEEADAIVYSSAAKNSKMAAQIAAAVRKGAALYVAANVPDPEIAALLPVEILARDIAGFPERRHIRASDPAAPELQELSSAKFGVYRDLQLRPGAQTLIAYEDGAPLAVRRDKVVYNALGLGTGILKEKAAIDPFMLRMLALTTGRKIAEKKLVRPVRQEGFLEGISAANIGRFGFALGDGLLCETFGNALTVSSGAGQYEFREAAVPKLRLAKWHIRSISGAPAEAERDVDWNYRYGQIGVVELSTTAEIPVTWRGKTLHFQVERGIDDVAKVYFNDTLLGEVTSQMPNYWDRPHRYKLAPELIRFGGENTIRVVTENLRESGGFGSCPEILQSGNRRAELDVQIDRANPLGKGGTVTDRKRGSVYRFDTSLAFPGIRWEFPGDFIFLSLGNVASEAAVFSNGKITRINATKNPVLTEKWDKPILLLYPKDRGKPLLLVFSRQPDSVTFDFTGGELSGLSIARKEGIGMVLPLWIEGTRQVSTAGWEKKLPDELVKRIDFWIPKAFAFPIGCREFFRIDPKEERVRIRTTYSFCETPNDWKVKPEHFAPVSPLAYFTKGRLFEADGVENWQLATAFGWFAAKPESDRVEWSLPLPKEELPLYPGIDAGEPVNSVINEVYAKAARFIGGHRPAETANFVHPFKPDSPTRNICLHMWLHGMSDTAVAPFGLNAKNLDHFKARMAYRLLLPVEQYGYKSATLWREEPYSALRYPVCYNSPRPHYTKFAPGEESNFNFYDSNESVYMITTVACAAAEQFGQREFILANPGWFRWFTKLIFSGDDPVTLTGHCGESGGAASIDMLNCEYAGMMNVARIADILGDSEWRDQCLYRAARRMVATLARFPFKNYVRETEQALFRPNDVYGTGFTEFGYEYRFGIVSINASYHLYDMSQGIPPRLLSLYDHYIPKEQEAYLRRFILPSLYDENGKYKQDHKVMNMASRSKTLSGSEKMKIVQDCLANRNLLNHLSADYPGIGLVSNVTMALDRISGGIRAVDCRDLDIRSFYYDPQKKTLRAEIVTGKAPLLILESDLEPADSAFRRDRNGRFEVPLKPDSTNTLTIELK